MKPRTPATQRPLPAAREVPLLAAVWCAFGAIAAVPGTMPELVAAGALLLLPMSVAGRMAGTEGVRSVSALVAAVLCVGALVLQYAGRLGALQAFGSVCAFLLYHLSLCPRSRGTYLQAWLLSALLLALGAGAGTPTVALGFCVGWALASVVFLAGLSENDFRRRPALRPMIDSPRYLGPPVGTRRLHGRTGANGLLLGGLRLAGPGALALGVLLFLLIPRPPQMSVPEGRSLAAAPSARSATVRLTNEVRFDAVESVRQQDGIALRVTLPQPGVIYPDLRLRVSVLDRFDGWGWRRSPEASDQSWRLSSRRPHPDFQINPWRQPATPGTLPPATGFRRRTEVWGVVPVDFDAAQVPLLSGAVGVSGFPDGELSLAADGVTSSLAPLPGRYLVHVDPRRPTAALRGEPGADHREVPAAFDAEALRAFVAARVRPDTDPARRARELAAWFARHGQWTFDTARLEGPESVRALFTETPVGHCELFATALALALRAEGIPTRLAVGYKGGEFDPSGAPDNPLPAITMRHRDAHAWVEAWVEGEGWIELDPTPGQADPPRGSAVARAAGTFFELAFLSYDGEVQRRLWRWGVVRLGRLLPEGRPGLFERSAARLRQNMLEPPILALAAGLVVLNVVAAWGLRRVRREAPLRQRLAELVGRRLHAPGRLLGRLLRILQPAAAVHSVRRARGDSGADALRQAALAAGALPDEIDRLVAAYWRARFGPAAERATAGARAIDEARRVHLAQAARSGVSGRQGSGR